MIGISYFGSMQVLANLAENIEIPVYLQIDQGRGWTVDGHIELFHALSGPKKLDIGSYPRCSRAPGSSVRGRVAALFLMSAGVALVIFLILAVHPFLGGHRSEFCQRCSWASSRRCWWRRWLRCWCPTRPG